MRRTASTPATSIAHAKPNRPNPSGLCRNGSRNPLLTSENTATKANGITVTTRADSRAWAVCTRNARRRASSPLDRLARRLEHRAHAAARLVLHVERHRHEGKLRPFPARAQRP